MIRRLPAIGFGLVALATVGAFFLIQRLKTAPPLLWPPLRSVPAAMNPLAGRTCTSVKGVPINYSETKLTLAIHQSDSVGVYIVAASDANGPPLDTITSGTQMRGSSDGTIAAKYSRVFTWNGRLSDGTVASPGLYYFRVVLHGPGRSINLSAWPIQVITQPQAPRILSVSLVQHGASAAASSTTTSATSTSTATTTTATTSAPPVLSPPQGKVSTWVKITFSRLAYRRATIDIYRTDVPGKPQLATTLTVRKLSHNSVLWNGKISGAPAPAGTYLVGIRAQDVACDPETWPVVLPPAPGTTPHDGVTVRYLSVTPPLTPTVSGSQASVAIDSANARFVWRLRRTGSRKLIAHGSGPAGSTQIHVRMPRHRPGLYVLTVRAGTERAEVPLVASQAGLAAARARVLVVLPILSWVGDAPVDDSGDGLPDTLRAGDAVTLARPLVAGLTTGFADDAALLRYLDGQHLKYQLTTDVALAEGHGPSLVNRWGVLFPSGEEFLPASLKSTLSGFVKAGGRVAALGIGSFQGTVDITGFPAAPRTAAPVSAPVDPFGATHGHLTPTNGELITELTDALGLFTGTSAFSGFSRYQPIQPPSGATISEAGIADGTPAIVGFHDGSGTVIEVGLPGFGASLAHNFDSQELFSNAWRVLAKER